jgi:hypothetical protein
MQLKSGQNLSNPSQKAATKPAKTAEKPIWLKMQHLIVK